MTPLSFMGRGHFASSSARAFFLPSPWPSWEASSALQVEQRTHLFWPP
ncbi:MAG: hypothetical protein JKY65_31245 [Planctomycetes bacterium]|nr:hypothetical protein [Planctomycetota bacterium]